MTVQIDERRHLREAMQHLTFGDSRRFCDLLWLGFGDQWRSMLSDLLSHQLVRGRATAEGEQFEITPRGRSWTLQAGVMAATAA